MRKPRDYHAELKALDDKAKSLHERQRRQLGELVIACRADRLSIEELAGALLAAASVDRAQREAWRLAGADFFRRARKTASGAKPSQQSKANEPGGTLPFDGTPGAA